MLRASPKARIFRVDMRFRSITVCLVLSALVWLGAVVPLCASVQGDEMPCCRGDAACNLEMRASNCCRVGAASERETSLAPAATPRLSLERILHATALPLFLLSAPPTTTLLAMAALPGSPAHRAEGPPLFLLNTALLR